MVNTSTVYLINVTAKHDALHSPHYRSLHWYLIFWRFPFQILARRWVIPHEVFHDFPETLETNSSTVVLNVSLYILPSLSFIAFLPFLFLHDATSAGDTAQIDTLHTGHIGNIFVSSHSSLHSCCSELFIGQRLLAPERKMCMIPESKQRPLYALRYHMYAQQCYHIFQSVPKLKYNMSIVMYVSTYHNYANKFYHSRRFQKERQLVICALR
jgi:hypothetical protein